MLSFWIPRALPKKNVSSSALTPCWIRNYQSFCHVTVDKLTSRGRRTASVQPRTVRLSHVQQLRSLYWKTSTRNWSLRTAKGFPQERNQICKFGLQVQGRKKGIRLFKMFDPRRYEQGDWAWRINGFRRQETWDQDGSREKERQRRQRPQKEEFQQRLLKRGMKICWLIAGEI